MSASMPEGCAVTGTVFHSTEQTLALLHSDCLIEIQRDARWIIMTSPRWVVAVEIPPTLEERKSTFTSGSPWVLCELGPTTSEWGAVAGRRRWGVKVGMGTLFLHLQ